MQQTVYHQHDEFYLHGAAAAHSLFHAWARHRKTRQRPTQQQIVLAADSRAQSITKTKGYKRTARNKKRCWSLDIHLESFLRRGCTGRKGWAIDLSNKVLYFSSSPRLFLQFNPAPGVLFRNELVFLKSCVQPLFIFHEVLGRGLRSGEKPNYEILRKATSPPFVPCDFLG